MGTNVSTGIKLSKYDVLLLKHINDTTLPYPKNIRARILKDKWAKLKASHWPYLWKLTCYFWQAWVWYSPLTISGRLQSLETMSLIKSDLEKAEQRNERLAMEMTGKVPVCNQRVTLYYELKGWGYHYIT